MTIDVDKRSKLKDGFYTYHFTKITHFGFDVRGKCVSTNYCK